MLTLEGGGVYELDGNRFSSGVKGVRVNWLKRHAQGGWRRSWWHNGGRGLEKREETTIIIATNNTFVELDHLFRKS